jgi:hypothetical protein
LVVIGTSEAFPYRGHRWVVGGGVGVDLVKWIVDASIWRLSLSTWERAVLDIT